MVQQAEDATATSFALGVFDFEGTAVPSYAAPLLSVGTLDTQTKQQRVVFGTDPSKRGGKYRFTVSAARRCHSVADLQGWCCLCSKGMPADCAGRADGMLLTDPMHCFR